MAELRHMDQVHQILDQAREEDIEEQRFFQVKIVPIQKKGMDEVMVQIQNISERVQSQFLKVEREYMSLMNSTNSHQMRNPLNSLISNIERLDQIQRVFLPQIDHSENNLSLLKEFEMNLDLAKSSTKLIQFSVEDILALPQLKQGRLVKNVEKINLRKAVDEVVQVFQGTISQKQLDLEVDIKNLPGSGFVDLDQKRFQ